MILKATGIGMRYDDATIIENCTIELPERTSIALVGPSGIGKSTLLSILGLLLEPTSGSVEVDGKDVLGLDDDERSRIRNERFGFVFQATQLIGSLTVFENVLVPALLWNRKGLENRAAELIGKMGLDDRMDYYPHQLSIGQQRRVSIARALLLEPQVVFADEPTNDLDPESARAAGDILFGLPELGCSLLIVTHDAELASRADIVYRVNPDGLTREK